MTQQNPPKNETLLLSSQLDLNFADTLNTINALECIAGLTNCLYPLAARCAGDCATKNSENRRISRHAKGQTLREDG